MKTEEKTKKKRVRKLSPNQIRVLARIAEQVKRGEKVVVTKAMQGIYSPATAKHPEKINKLPEYEALINEHLPDSKLAEKHRQLLDAGQLEKLYFNESDSDEVIGHVVENMPGYSLLHIVAPENSDGRVTSKYAYVRAPDSNTQDKALDKAYKIKGHYPKEGANVALQFNFGGNPPEYRQ